jgi:hypothetical protein
MDMRQVKMHAFAVTRRPIDTSDNLGEDHLLISIATGLRHGSAFSLLTL